MSEVQENQNRRITFAHNDSNVYSGLLSATTTPIANEINKRELKRLKESYLGRVKFIPFLEFGDAKLQVLNDLATTTPSISSCNRLYFNYLGLNKMTVVVKSSDFDLDEDEIIVPIETKLAFVTLLSSLLGGKQGMREFKIAISKAATNLLVYGNLCFELIRAKKGRARSYRIRKLDFAHFRYENTENQDLLGDYGIVCEDFERVNIDPEIKFQRYSMFPNFTDMGDGTERCIIHYKNGDASGRDWYGLPYSIGSLYSQFQEAQENKLSSIDLNNRLLPRLVVVKEEPADYDTSKTSEERKEDAKKFNRKFTMAGSKNGEDVDNVLELLYPKDTAKPDVIQVKETKDTDYFEFLSNKVASDIYKVCAVNEILLEKGGNNLSGGNALYQAAVIFYNTSVVPMKEKLLDPIMEIIDNALEFMGYANSENLTIDFKEPNILVKLRELAAEETGGLQNSQIDAQKPQTAQQAATEDTASDF